MTPSPTAARTVSEIMRPAAFVPETKRVVDLLREFQQRPVPARASSSTSTAARPASSPSRTSSRNWSARFATSTTARPSPIVREADDTFVFSGKVAIGEMTDRLGVEIEDGEFETVGGFVLARVGRVPAVGERFEIDGLDVEILEAERRRIHKVRVRRRQQPPPRKRTE